MYDNRIRPSGSNGTDTPTTIIVNLYIRSFAKIDDVKMVRMTYRAEKKSWQILLSRTQVGPGRKVKEEQEEISRNHVPRLFLGSVHI